MDEILRCYHSNETSLAVVSYNSICFSAFHKMKFADFDFGHFREEMVHIQKARGVFDRTNPLNTDFRPKFSISPIYHMIYPVCSDGLCLLRIISLEY